MDAATYNVLVFWGGHGPMFDLPILAKIIAIVLASIATYLGNHWWTFRDRKNRPSVRQILVFALINGGAILLQLGCLGFSRYVLGLADPVADNISGTLIGQALATIFRYFMYDRYVFPAQRVSDAADEH